jgi:glutamate synthase domain-containing protein 3
MHGGVIYERGKILEVGKGTRLMNTGKRDNQLIQKSVTEFCNNFDLDYKKIMNEKFYKIVPISKRPYGKLYSH